MGHIALFAYLAFGENAKAYRIPQEYIALFAYLAVSEDAKSISRRRKYLAMLDAICG